MKKDTKKTKYKTKYHFNIDDFWHQYFDIEIITRDKPAYCKHCKLSININDEAGIVWYKYGHNLPNDCFDVHFIGMIAIVHPSCINKFVISQKF